MVPTRDAKLIFTLRGVSGPQVERMWVNITGYTEAGYVGVSDNETAHARRPDRAGQTVDFGPGTIIDALPPANWNPETREYED